MSDYLQPDFYRFNQDSLFLVNWISQRMKTASHILDIGAGTGVIGIELSNRLSPDSVTLLELQPDFLPFLEKNSVTQKKGSYDLEVIIGSIGEWNPGMTFDLIVSNPPYYLPGHGEASQDLRKGKARSFIVDGWKVLLRKIETLLTPDGHAYIVIKNDKSLLAHVRKEVGGLRLTEFEEKDLVVLQLTRLHENGHHKLS
ncbi:methyltransferase [Peredibacter sp. HCB2-198]|uniref:methyltransferase n=1 Tax=Peredibacter sp. HCB2-198 TaxID=3383025 RepID=UPI0038B68811